MGLSVRIVRFDKYVIKTRTGENPAVKRLMTLRILPFNVPEDLTFGFDSSNV